MAARRCCAALDSRSHRASAWPCLVAILPATRGRVLVDETEITGWSSYRRSVAGLAYVPQGREIFSELTVGENIDAAARATGTLGTGIPEGTTTHVRVL